MIKLLPFFFFLLLPLLLPGCGGSEVGLEISIFSPVNVGFTTYVTASQIMSGASTWETSLDNPEGIPWSMRADFDKDLSKVPAKVFDDGPAKYATRITLPVKENEDPAPIWSMLVDWAIFQRDNTLTGEQICNFGPDGPVYIEIDTSGAYCDSEMPEGYHDLHGWVEMELPSNFAPTKNFPRAIKDPHLFSPVLGPFVASK